MTEEIIPVVLDRGQMGKAKGLDVTVKSGQLFARTFAPTWAMVLGHKNHRAQQKGDALRFPDHPPLSDEEYTRLYLQILAKAGHAWKELYEYALENGRKVTLLCYCANGSFCHTHLMIDFAVDHWPERFQDGRAIYFNSKTEPWAWLSNFHYCRIESRDGRIWPSAEHMYQGYKCHFDTEAEEIRTAFSAQDAKKLGARCKARSDWKETRDISMREVLRAKFTQDAALKALLLSTGDRELIHLAPWDEYWGTGKDGTGHNMQGKLLMELRDELRRPTDENV